MGSNLSKVPLTGVVYAALYFFVVSMMPSSDLYRFAKAGFQMPIWGYLLLIGYAAWICAPVAILFYHSRSGGISLVAPLAVSLAGLVCLMPMLEQVAFKHPLGDMSPADTYNEIAAWLVATVLMLVLAVLLFHRGQPAGAKPAEKVSFQVVHLAIKIAVAPFLYCVLFFFFYYFLFWNNEAVRLFYSDGSFGADGFVRAIIDLLYNTPGLVGFSLLQGLLLPLLSLPLLLQLPGKRPLFLVVNSMLYLSTSLYHLVPSAVLPGDVRVALVLRWGALLLLYSVAVGFLLHTSLIVEKLPVAQPTQQPAGRPGAPAQRPGAAPRPGARPVRR